MFQTSIYTSGPCRISRWSYGKQMTMVHWPTKLVGPCSPSQRVCIRPIEFWLKDLLLTSSHLCSHHSSADFLSNALWSEQPARRAWSRRLHNDRLSAGIPRYLHPHHDRLPLWPRKALRRCSRRTPGDGVEVQCHHQLCSHLGLFFAEVRHHRHPETNPRIWTQDHHPILGPGPYIAGLHSGNVGVVVRAVQTG